MAESGLDGTSFHSGFLNLSAFLGAITFTALVLLIESKDKFWFADWLISATAIVSSSFILATLGRILLVGNANVGKHYENVVAVFTFTGFFGLMVIIPFFVLPFTIIGTVVVACFEGVAIYTLFHTVPNRQ